MPTGRWERIIRKYGNSYYISIPKELAGRLLARSRRVEITLVGDCIVIRPKG